MKKIFIGFLLVIAGLVMVGCTDTIDLAKVEIPAITYATGEDATKVKSGFTLPLEAKEGKVIISWEVDKGVIVAIAGATATVTRQAADEVVKLTPTVKLKDSKDVGIEREVISITILKKDGGIPTEYETYDFDIAGSFPGHPEPEWNGYAKVVTPETLKVKDSAKVVLASRLGALINKTETQTGFALGALVLRPNQNADVPSEVYISFTLNKVVKVEFDMSLWTNMTVDPYDPTNVDATPEAFIFQVKQGDSWVDNKDLTADLVGAHAKGVKTIVIDGLDAEEFRFLVKDTTTAKPRVVISRLLITGELKEVSEVDKTVLNADIAAAKVMVTDANYAASTRTALGLVITDAEKVAGNFFATTEEVEAAIDAVKASVAALTSSTADVSTEAELIAALANIDIILINIKADINLTAGLVLARSGVTINGENHKLDLQLAAPATWSGEYVLQVYVASDVVIKDIILTGGNAGLLINGSKVALQGKVDVSTNGFGGIEVAQGEGVTAIPELTISAGLELINTTEIKELPTVWLDKLSVGIIDTADILFADQKITKNQVYFYLDSTLVDVHTDVDYIAKVKADLMVQLSAIDDFTLPREVKVTLGEVEKTITITWTSDNAAIVLAEEATEWTATVIRPAAGAGNAVVRLTATLTLGTETDTKTFDVDVAEEPANDNQTYVETFDTLGLSESAYTKAEHSFTGVNAQVWTITKDARGDELMDGSAALLIRIGDLSTTLPNGLSALSFNHKPIFANGKSRYFDIYINDLFVKKVTGGTKVTDPGADPMEVFSISDLNYKGNVKLEIRGLGAQKLIDNLTWTENV